MATYLAVLLMDRPEPLRFDTSVPEILEDETLEDYFRRYFSALNEIYAEVAMAIMLWGGGIVMAKNEVYQDYDLPMGTIRVMNDDGTYEDSNGFDAIRFQ